MSVVGLNGFDCEMASGAVPAARPQARHEGIINNDDIVVGILTGQQKESSVSSNLSYKFNQYICKASKEQLREGNLLQIDYSDYLDDKNIINSVVDNNYQFSKHR